MNYWHHVNATEYVTLCLQSKDELQLTFFALGLNNWWITVRRYHHLAKLQLVVWSNKTFKNVHHEVEGKSTLCRKMYFMAEIIMISVCTACDFFYTKT